MPKTLKGIVVSDKMQKTVVVAARRLRKHPKYKRYYKITTRFKVHDEQNAYHVGDNVFIQETRPLSKEKRWKVVGVVEVAKPKTQDQKPETNPSA